MVLPEGYLINIVPSLLNNTPSIDEYFVFSLSTIIEFKELQSSNTRILISVTEYGIVIEVKELQP